MFKSTLILSGAALSLGAASLAQAAILAQYPFTGNSAASTDADTNSTANSVTGNGLAVSYRAAGGGVLLGGNSAPGIGDTYGNVTNRNTTGGASTGNFFGENFAATEADSVTNNDYYAFSITPAGGYKLNLSNLSFDFAIGTTGSSNGIAFFVRSDAEATDFTTTLGRAGTTANSFSSATVSLAGTDFQNVTAAITFRIYAYDRGSTSNTISASAYAGFYFDNLALTGQAVLIPEPATLALLSLSLMPLALRRPRRL